MWLPRGYSLVALKAYPWEGCLKHKCAICAREAGVSNWTLGPDAKLIDWLDEITADCLKKSARNMNDQCGARCPDLPKVL